MLLSIIIPLFNEEEVLGFLYNRLRDVTDRLDVDTEMIFVNDGSSDHTLTQLLKYSTEDDRVKILDLSRNFGHQIAITAGLDFANGDAVVVMDGDLQDPPELIPQMLELFREGYYVIYAKRRQREGESWFKRATAHLFYRVIRQMTSFDLPADTGDFRFMSRQVVDALLTMREQHRFVRGLVSWVGFKQTEILFDRNPRAAGRPKYNLRKMMLFALDSIFSFSAKPLRFVTLLGFTNLSAGMIYLTYNLYLHFFLNLTVQGWTSLLVIQIFLAGTLMIAIGVVGEYVARIYEEIKHRPLYIVRQAVNLYPVSNKNRAVAGDSASSPAPASIVQSGRGKNEDNS